jgi:hypothetical protein
MRTYFTSILVLLGFLLTDSAWAAPPHLDSPPRVRHEVGNGFVYVPPQPVTLQFNNPGPQISVPQTGNAVEQLSPSLALGSRMRWESNRSGCRERWKDACQFSITGGAAMSSIGHVTTLDGEPAGPWSRTHDWGSHTGASLSGPGQVPEIIGRPSGAPLEILRNAPPPILSFVANSRCQNLLNTPAVDDDCHRGSASQLPLSTILSDCTYG